MVRGVKEWTDRHRVALIIASLCSIIIIYLVCVGGQDWKALLYYLYPETLIRGLMLLCAYLAWKSYINEKSSSAICILFSTATVILPFMVENDRYEMLFEFCWCLWPGVVIAFVNKGIRKLLQSKRLVCCADTIVIALLAAVFHCMAESAGENNICDFCIPVMWLIQGLAWASVSCYASKTEKRKRNTVITWIGCLFLFVCFTYLDVSYLASSNMWSEVRGRYWNKVISLTWPVLVFVLWKMIDSHIAKQKPYYVQKISLIYFTAVLLVIYAVTRLDLNWAIACFVYDIDQILFCLFLAELVLWNELYQKQEALGSRIRSFLFMTAMNVGVLVVLLLQNERLREIMRYLAEFLTGGSQAGWIAYRKTAICAFLTKDMSVLDELYKKEAYWEALSGHGIAGIWFYVGSLPVLLMIFFVVLLVILLWNWNRENRILNKYAKYLAVGYMLKMGLAVLLQTNLICAAYMEFPFTGQDIAESFVLGLLIFAGGGEQNAIQKNAKVPEK